ncbi:hypothetical protein [Sulfurihydrogenibium azorense]|uniref:hypothetical protein n=1 Tax=Sulfurihydrogenibium azorense TaxID=309806 RepID=UPI00391A90DF
MKKYFLILFLLISYKILAIDNLFLVGKVEDYFPVTNELKINVESSSCKGTRYFTIDKKLNKNIIGKEIYFSIDSSSCEKNTKYKIVEFFIGE